jgi:hypothetical protein
MAAPTFVASYASVYNTNTSPRTVTVTTQAGDVVVVYGSMEANTHGVLNTPTGNSVSFSLQASFDTSTTFSPVYMWAGTDNTGGTNWTLSVSRSVAGSEKWGITCLVFRNAALGTAVATTRSDGPYTTTITTTQANSAIVSLLADWDANADSGNTRVWATVNGNTPSSGNGQEINYEYSSGAYTVFGAYYTDAGSIGTKTVGLSTGPGTLPHISFVTLEVKGVVAATPGLIGWTSFGNSMDPALTLARNFYGRYDFPGGDWTDGSGNGNDVTLFNGGYTLAANRKGFANNAYTFDGLTGYAYTTTSFNNPQVYSANAWFKTTDTIGGVIVGFADTQFTSVNSYDRMMYMEAGGRLNFGAFDGTTAFVARSTSSYNDGNWHMATMVMHPTAGMTLYVDGVSVATNSNTLSENYNGWWHVGYDGTGSWPNAGGRYFNGTLDDVWIYKIALTSTQVTQLYNI